MSELEHNPPDGPPGDAGWSDLAELPVEAVRELFVVLGKAFRAYQLYDENNPVRHRFIESLRQAFLGLWNDLDRLSLHVEEDRILLGEEAVYQAANRAESFAFLFYKDGVREITFLPGIEAEELEPFLGALQRARKLVPDSDDLLTVLWDEDLVYFQYQYIDFLAEGVDLPVPGDGAGQNVLQTVLRTELEEDGGEGEEEEDGAEAEGAGEGAEPAHQTVRQEDFNPTLYALDTREVEVLRRELHKEVHRDLRGEVLSALFDRMEESERPERQAEILDILGILLPNFLSRGGLVPATRVLEELRRLEGTQGIFDENLLAKARDLLDAASSPEAIDELIQALYDGSIRASSLQLSAFLRHLRAGAIAPLLREAETVDHRELREVLRSAVRGIAERNRGAVVRLLSHRDPVIASGAARLAGDIQVAEAGPALAGLLAHDEAEVRLAAVEAAAALKASTAAGPLEQTLDDPERDVRVAAARALGVLRYAPAASRLQAVLESREIRQADISEKVAFFEAFAMVAQEQSLPMLDRLLNGRGFLGKREPPEIRAAAALGLGRVESPSARESLMRASQEEDPVVRSAVNRALRTEE
jgi:hypothetical protein